MTEPKGPTAGISSLLDARLVPSNTIKEENRTYTGKRRKEQHSAKKEREMLRRRKKSKEVIWAEVYRHLVAVMKAVEICALSYLLIILMNGRSV